MTPLSLLFVTLSRLTQKQGSSQLFFFPQPFVHGGFILTVLSQYIILKQWMQLKQALPELLIQTNQSSSNLQHNPHCDSIINTENIHNKLLIWFPEGPYQGVHFVLCYLASILLYMVLPAPHNEALRGINFHPPITGSRLTGSLPTKPLITCSCPCRHLDSAP